MFPTIRWFTMKLWNLFDKGKIYNPCKPIINHRDSGQSRMYQGFWYIHSAHSYLGLLLLNAAHLLTTIHYQLSSIWLMGLGETKPSIAGRDLQLITLFSIVVISSLLPFLFCFFLLQDLTCTRWFLSIWVVVIMSESPLTWWLCWSR